MEKGDVLGHEFMGEVVEVGPGVRNLRPGDRVVVPFPISCGACFFCKKGLFSCCENSNPNAPLAEALWGHSPAGIFDKMPLGAAMNKGLTIRTGQTHVHRYMRPLLERIERGEIDPTFVITHQLPLAEAPQAYDIFCNKEDECVKVVLKPNV